MQDHGGWVGFLCSRHMNAVSHAMLTLNSELILVTKGRSLNLRLRLDEAVTLPCHCNIDSWPLKMRFPTVMTLTVNHRDVSRSLLRLAHVCEAFLHRTAPSFDS